MIASEAAPSHQQGNATLHDPSLGKNGKALRRILGLWMGFDQALVASCAQTPHYLNVPPELFFNPHQETYPRNDYHPKSRKVWERGQTAAQGVLCLQDKSEVLAKLSTSSHQIALRYPQAMMLFKASLNLHDLFVIALLGSSGRCAGLPGGWSIHCRTGLFEARHWPECAGALLYCAGPSEHPGSQERLDFCHKRK